MPILELKKYITYLKFYHIKYNSLKVLVDNFKLLMIKHSHKFTKRKKKNKQSNSFKQYKFIQWNEWIHKWCDKIQTVASSDRKSNSILKKLQTVPKLNINWLYTSINECEYTVILIKQQHLWTTIETKISCKVHIFSVIENLSNAKSSLTLLHKMLHSIGCVSITSKNSH